VSNSTECHPKVVAVVLTWNDIDMTARCVDSLLATGYSGLGIVVVDNGSNPPGCPILKQRFPSIEPVQLPENLGFTGGCNRGLTRAMELGADYVFLLNNDTIVGEQAIEQLVQAMERMPEVGQASAVLLYPGAEKRIGFLCCKVSRDSIQQERLHENELLSDIHRKICESNFVPACAVMFRPQALRQVGLFDETLFTNWEDYDLCCRLVDRGWRIVTVGTAEVVHAHGQTTGRISPFITYLFTRNRLICLFRYGKPMAILWQSPRILRQFYWQIRGYGLTNWPAHRAFVRGVMDFLLGVRGKGHLPADRRDRAKQDAASKTAESPASRPG
jgi:GT2 family glycosyltransferase